VVIALFFLINIDAMLQILQQVQNQLLAPSPSSAGSLKKRAVPEFTNPMELRKLLEKMQRRFG